MAMSVVVRKSLSVVVRPSEPVTKSGSIRLSSFDESIVKLPVTSILVFEHPIHEPAETIKRALSQALVTYHPISGRIISGAEDDEFYIQCTGQGVEYVAASANCALKDVDFIIDPSPAGTRTLLDDLAVYYPAEGCGPADPLLFMQVTQFSCGGFIIGVTWNHGIADGAGMAQFLQAVGELARGLPAPSIVPVRSDASLPTLPPRLSAMHKLITILEPMDLVGLEITIPLSLINRMKAEYGSRFSGQPCTIFEAALAVLWQCRTRAIMESPETPTSLLFTANMRKHVGASEGYYGNCSIDQLVMAASGAVANGDVMDLIKMIKGAKDQIPDQFTKNEESEQLQVGISKEQLTYQVRYNTLIVSSWINLGFDKADFGSGTPARVVWPGKPPLPACVMCPPCKGKEGVNVRSGCVKEEHADAFLEALARFK